MEGANLPNHSFRDEDFMLGSVDKNIAVSQKSCYNGFVTYFNLILLHGDRASVVAQLLSWQSENLALKTRIESLAQVNVTKSS